MFWPFRRKPKTPVVECFECDDRHLRFRIYNVRDAIAALDELKDCVPEWIAEPEFSVVEVHGCDHFLGFVYGKRKATLPNG